MQAIDVKHLVSCYNELPRDVRDDCLGALVTALATAREVIDGALEDCCWNPRLDEVCVAVTFTADGIAFDGHELGGGAGRLAKFALLWRAEHAGEAFSGAFGYGFVGQPSKSRFGGLRWEMKKALRSISPGSGFRIECVRARSVKQCSTGAASQFSDFRMLWNDHIRLTGPMADAQVFSSQAQSLLKRRELPETILAATAAIRKCPLLFRPFVVLREALEYMDGGRFPESSDADNWPQTAFHGMSEMKKWLASLQASFDMALVSDGERVDVQRECLDDIAARLRKLRNLEQHLNDSSAGAGICRNPVNIVLRHVRDAIAAGPASVALQELVPTDVWADYLSIEEEALERVEEEEVTLHGRNVRGELRAALLELAGKERFSFPESDGSSEQWRSQTVQQWVKAVFDRDHLT